MRIFNSWKQPTSKKKKVDSKNLFEDDTLPSKWKMRKRINSLESENEILKEVIQDELYKKFMDKLGEPEKIQRLTEENKRLRLQNKNFKEEIKNANRKK